MFIWEYNEYDVRSRRDDRRPQCDCRGAEAQEPRRAHGWASVRDREVVERLRIPQPAVCKHLAVLPDVEIVSVNTDGWASFLSRQCEGPKAGATDEDIQAFLASPARPNQGAGRARVHATINSQERPDKNREVRSC